MGARSAHGGGCGWIPGSRAPREHGGRRRRCGPSGRGCARAGRCRGVAGYRVASARASFEPPRCRARERRGRALHRQQVDRLPGRPHTERNAWHAPRAGVGGGRMTIEVNGLHHFVIRVQDPDVSRAFYEQTFDFTFIELPVGAAIANAWRGHPNEGTLLATALGDTFLVLAPPLEGTPDDDRFNERRV